MKPILVDMEELLQLIPFDEGELRREIDRGRFPVGRLFGGKTMWIRQEVDDWAAGLPVKDGSKQTRPASEVTELYRHFDADGQLLYVGISLSAVVRLCAHMNCSPWADQIAMLTIERHPTREAAMAAERAAVKEERPLHNITHAERKP